MVINKQRDFNILLDDKTVEFIMGKFNLGIYDILLAIDNNEITIELRDVGSIFYYYIIISGKEARLSDRLAKMDVQAYEKGNVNYYKELVRQCLKYEVSVEIDLNEAMSLLEGDTNVYYKNNFNGELVKLNINSQYTIEEFSKMKFFIKK